MKHYGFSHVLILLVLVAFIGAAAANQQKLTNKDVIKMVKAGLPADVIVQAIKSSAPDFDVSADGLIALKQEGVPDSVIQAMISRVSPTATQPAKSSSGGLMETEAVARGVTLIDGANRIQMRRANPSGGRTGGVGMKVLNPFGKIKMLQTFNGNHAQLRTNNTSPVFEVLLPGDLNPSDSVILVKFSVKSDRREISVGRGRLGASTGISKDDMLPISIDELQTKNASPYRQKLYRVSLV